MKVIKTVPLKIRKLMKRWWRSCFAVVAFYVSIHHVKEATDKALHTRIDVNQLSVVKQLGICVKAATVDIGSMLGDGFFTTHVAVKAFAGYFWNHPFFALVAFFAFFEMFRHIYCGVKFARRWKNANKARKTASQQHTTDI